MKKTFLKRLVASVLALSILSGIIGTAVFAEPASADVTPSLRGNGQFTSTDSQVDISEYNYTAAYGKFLEVIEAAKPTPNKIDISIKPGTVEALEAGTHDENTGIAAATKMPIGIIPNGDLENNKMAVVGVAIPKPTKENAANTDQITGVKVDGGDVIKLGEGENTGTDAQTGKLITYLKFAEYDGTKWTSVANSRELNLVWCGDSGEELYTSKVEINITKNAPAYLEKKTEVDTNNAFVKSASGVGRVFADVDGAAVANTNNAATLDGMVFAGGSPNTAYFKYFYPPVSGAAAYKIGDDILEKNQKKLIADDMVVNVQNNGRIDFYLPFAVKGDDGKWTALPTGITTIKLEALLSATNAASVFAEGALAFSRKTNNDYGNIQIDLDESNSNILRSDCTIKATNIVDGKSYTLKGKSDGKYEADPSTIPYGKYEVTVENNLRKVLSKILVELNSDMAKAKIELVAATVDINEDKLPKNFDGVSKHITPAPADAAATVSGDFVAAVAADSDVNAAFSENGKEVAIKVRQEIVIPPSNQNKEAAADELQEMIAEGDIEEVTENSAKSMIAALSAIPNNLEPVLAIDISIEANINNGTIKKWITELNQPLNISLQIPGEIDDSNGFTVYRSHMANGQDYHSVDPIIPSYDKELRILTFQSDKFSTFVVVAGKPSSSGIINNSSSKTVTCTVDVKASEGGKIIPEGATTVKQGEEINYEFLPNPGYEVGAIIVDGVNIGKGRAYNMKKIYDDITLEVQFVKVSGSSSGTGTVVPQTGIAELLPLF